MTSSRALESQMSSSFHLTKPEVFSAPSARKGKKLKPFSKWDWIFPASLNIQRIVFPSPVWCTPYFWAATCSPCHRFPIGPLQMPSVFPPWLIIKLFNQLLRPRVCKQNHNLHLPLLKCKQLQKSLDRLYNPAGLCWSHGWTYPLTAEPWRGYKSKLCCCWWDTKMESKGFQNQPSVGMVV